MQEILADADRAGSVCGTLRRGAGGPRQFLAALAAAWVSGASVNWPEVTGPPRRQLDLPTYPFDRERFWLGSGSRATFGPASHPLLPVVVPVAGDGGLLLSGRLSRKVAPWLAGHSVAGTVLVPGTAFADLAVHAASAAGAGQVEELTLHQPLPLPAAGAVQVQVAVGAANADGRRALTIHARPGDDPAASWTQHASGNLAGPAAATPGRLTQWPPPGADPVNLAGAYDRLAARGYTYGPAFRGLTAVWRSGPDLYAEVTLPGAAGPAAGYTVHPALLDAALHPLLLAGAAGTGRAADSSGLLLPFSWSGVWLSGHGVSQLRVRLTGEPRSGVRAEIYDTAGTPAGGIESLTMRPVTRGAVTAAPRPDLYQLDWVPTALAPVPRAELAGRQWAVLGAEPWAAELCRRLRADGLGVELAACLAALPDPVPSVVLVPSRPDRDPGPQSARAAVDHALSLLRQWCGDDRSGSSRLVFLADHWSLTGAPVWGLVRSAQAEHPGRLALAAPGALPAGAAGLLAAAVDAGEPQADLREGQVTVPRLARSVRAQTPAADLTGGPVLVTGGTTGLGALAAVHLAAEHGVRDLVLTSRRGQAAPGVTDLVRRLTGLGVSVRVVACDAADRTELTALLASLPGPLVGVVHAAGVLADATVTGLTAERLDAVWRPKADAAWLLHELTAGQPLRAFVLFSSLAGVLGNPGQGNYAAGNAFLDALAAWRHGSGRPAVSLAWGLWATPTSMTAGMSGADRARLAGAGVKALATERGLALLDAALATQGDDGAQLVAAHLDLTQLRARAGEDIPLVLRGLAGPFRRPAVPSLNQSAAAPPGPATGDRPASMAEEESLAGRLADLDQAQAAPIVADLVRTLVASSLGHASPDAVPPDKPFSELGVDSLISVELRNQLATRTGLRLPPSLLFNHPTVTVLAGYLAGQLVPSPAAPQRTGDLDLASDEEIFTLIDKRF